jgi:hypothetical protein
MAGIGTGRTRRANIQSTLTPRDCSILPPMSAAVDSQVVDSKEFIPILDYQFTGNDYTLERKRAFIELYREHGSIYHAARLTPVSRKTVYNWMDADPQFAEAVADSKEDSLDDLETSVYKRAFNDPILAMFYLKAHRHKFRDKTTVDITLVQAEIAEHVQSLGLKSLPAATTEFIPAVQSIEREPFSVPSSDSQKE